MWRVGIDTGGTFTDIVAVRSGEVRTAKVPSTPPHFDDGVLEGIEAVGLQPGDILLLAHGTTVTTNAIITKSGARTGLITTKGFRDVLELRRHNRGEIYDILWDPPEPLVPRLLRLEVSERKNYAGETVVPLEEDEVLQSLARLRDEGIESLAICFLHSYQNPEHEEQVRRIVQRTWPELYVSISSELLREPLEFERTSTTVVNAYVGPVLGTYVERLQRRLEGREFEGQLMIMHSGGGLLSADSVLRVPARTITSGPAAGAMAAEGFSSSGAPAAGAMAAEAVATTTGISQIISLDMGGTSADIAVVRDGKVLLINEYMPEFGLPIRFPAVDLVTIGAGGGSVAWVDAAGIPRVGPQSAGANPGPASYNRGGTHATVTDANLLLGRLSPDSPLAGGLRLDRASALAAVERFAVLLGLSVTDAALGIIDIVNSNMIRAIRVLTVERGLDFRDFVLLPFGGAGPMHACELAEQLSIGEVLIPIAPGVTSALGTLFVDLVHDLARSHVVPLKLVDTATAESILVQLESQAIRALEVDQVPAERRSTERSLDLRYLGQVKTLNIPIPSTPFSPGVLRDVHQRFLKEYKRRYHYVTEDIDIELSSIRVRGRGLQDKPHLPPHPAAPEPASVPRREVQFRGTKVDAPVHRRNQLRPGATLTGPLMVEQPDSTVVVPPAWTLAVDGFGNLRLTWDGQGRA